MSTPSPFFFNVLSLSLSLSLFVCLLACELVLFLFFYRVCLFLSHALSRLATYLLFDAASPCRNVASQSTVTKISRPFSLSLRF